MKDFSDLQCWYFTIILIVFFICCTIYAIVEKWIDRPQKTKEETEEDEE